MASFPGAGPSNLGLPTGERFQGENTMKRDIDMGGRGLGENVDRRLHVLKKKWSPRKSGYFIL